MLRLQPAQPDSLWNLLLPPGLELLPEDLRLVDELLCDPALLSPFVEHWRRHTPRGLADGRPTIPMATYVRLMIVDVRPVLGHQDEVVEVPLDQRRLGAQPVQ